MLAHGHTEESNKACYSPLLAAVHYGRADVACKLIHLGMAVNRGGKVGLLTPPSPTYDSAIEAAVRNDNVELVKTMLPHFKRESTESKSSLLHYACNNGSEDCFKLALDCMDVDCGDGGVNDRDGRGWTPIMYASQHNNGYVRRLLTLGASVILTEPARRYSPLEIAVELKSRVNLVEMPGIVEMLVNAGADVRRVTSNYRTPLILLCYSPKCLLLTSETNDPPQLRLMSDAILKCVKFLLKKKALSARYNKNPVTEVLKFSWEAAYHLLKQPHNNRVKVAEILFSHIADFVRLLLENGVNVTNDTYPSVNMVFIMVLLGYYSNTADTDVMHNPSINTSVYAVFKSIVTYGSRLCVPEDRLSLLSLLRVNFDAYYPFIEGYVNALDQKSLVHCLKDLRCFIEKNQDNFSVGEIELLKEQLRARRLTQICRSTIMQVWRPHVIHLLPLPNILKVYVCSLTR